MPLYRLRSMRPVLWVLEMMAYVCGICTLYLTKVIGDEA